MLSRGCGWEEGKVSCSFCGIAANTVCTILDLSVNTVWRTIDTLLVATIYFDLLKALTDEEVRFCNGF